LAIEVEIICIGNDLLIGKILNTNAHSLGLQVTALGANVKRVTVIQDIVEEIASTINEAVARKPRFIITTGGLGPTFDDKTFQGVAVALNRKLAVNEEALKMVKERMLAYFIRRGVNEPLEMTPPLVKMAKLPEGTEVVVNPIGTAPALKVDINGVTLYSLPGIPMEMEAIFNQTIASAIKEAVGKAAFSQRNLFVEMGESRLAPFVDQVMKDNPGIYIKSHPITSDDRPRVELHLTMVATEAVSPDKLLALATKQLAALIIANGGTVQEQT
jgi:molybdenum cofactor synthesis domain-containing protein